MDDRVLVLFIFADRLLLGRMKTKKFAANGTAFPWGLPGGTPRPDEAFDRTAVREARQETRKRISRHRFTKQLAITRDDYTFHVYSVRLSQREFREHVPPHREFIEFRWFKVREVPWGEMLPGTREWLEEVLYDELVRYL